MQEWIWIFNGENSRLPAAVFQDRDQAEEWIRKHKLSGLLTLYPVNKSVYDWAVEEGVFSPKKQREGSSSVIQSFTSASHEYNHDVTVVRET